MLFHRYQAFLCPPLSPVERGGVSQLDDGRCHRSSSCVAVIVPSVDLPPPPPTPAVVRTRRPWFVVPVATCRRQHTVSLQFWPDGSLSPTLFFDVVAVCVGSSRHLLDFSEFVCRNILWYGSTYAQILSTLISVMFSILSCSPVCHVLVGDNAHPHNTDKREH